MRGRRNRLARGRRTGAQVRPTAKKTAGALDSLSGRRPQQSDCPVRSPPTPGAPVRFAFARPTALFLDWARSDWTSSAGPAVLADPADSLLPVCGPDGTCGLGARRPRWPKPSGGAGQRRPLCNPGRSRPNRAQAATHAGGADRRDAAAGGPVGGAFANLKFNRPLLLTHAGDGSDRVFVASQLGQIHVFPNDQEVTETKIFLDLTDKTFYQDKEFETGVLGLAFHPQYPSNGQLFVFYSSSSSPYTNVVSRFRVRSDDPNAVDPKSEEVLLAIEKPFWNHNGGTLAFGPDGFLYIAVGDGGSGNDPFGNGQNLQTLLGKILRIDVDHTGSLMRVDPLKPAPPKICPYAVPADNPFLGKRQQARPEIWAYGLRNVWRMAFDPPTGTLWAGDVGQDLWEEIDLIVRGGNYGWNLREGRLSSRPTDRPPGPTWSSRSSSIRTRWASRSPAGWSIAARRCRRWPADICMPISSAANSGPCGTTPRPGA